MNPLIPLAALVDDPGVLSGGEKPAGFGRTGMLGYLAGTLGFFVFMRLFSAVPPGFLSFLVVLAFVLSANFFFAGVIGLFMDLTGAKGSAGRLFQAFGYTDYLLALLVPAAFFARLGGPGAFLWFCACFLLVIYARVRLIRRVYPVSANKALLSVTLPYAGLTALFFLAFVYSIAWLVWLVV